jgi:tetratricopeptide (TPR) repeat protein
MPGVWAIFVLWAGWAAAGAALAADAGGCHALRRTGREPQARSCYQGLAGSADPYLRAEGQWGLGLFNEANTSFKVAYARDARNPRILVRWGDLFFERYNNAEAAKLYQEALEADEKNARALLGLARVASDGFESKAVELAEKAIGIDAKLVEARELLASLALEDANPAKAVEEADRAIAMSASALDAMAVRAAVEVLADRTAESWINRIYSVNPRYGQAHELIGHHLMLNRRYEEAIAHFKKAIELNPALDSARSQLGVNLMRIGKEEEARLHLEQAYDNGWRDNPTVNTLRLMDSYKNFVTLKSAKGEVRLHKKEAELLQLYIPRELDRAVTTFEKKYKLSIREPVRVEVYPDHEDFAVRTMGMPGLGALGVTFGTVVAMDSPSGRKPGSFHWASTLWHELSHVFVLTATKHRVPRWFTEGLAVHEETAAAPDWGDRVTPDIIAALREKKLLPVAEMDRGFIRPKYPAQVVVSYFQAGQICDYIKERWGYDRLLEMMHAFAARKSTPEVIEQLLGMKPEDFDQAFFGWLDGRMSKQVAGYPEWQKRMRALAANKEKSDPDQVLREAKELGDKFPEYVEHGSAWEIAADAWEKKGDRTKAREALETWARIGGRDPALLKRLAAMQEQAGMKREAIATLEKINFIYPVNDEEMHQRLGSLYMELGRPSDAVREFRAVVASQPVDRASANYQLARAYLAARQPDKAEVHVIEALEAAPGFRPAQKLLLELDAGRKEKN